MVKVHGRNRHQKVDTIYFYPLRLKLLALPVVTSHVAVPMVWRCLMWTSYLGFRSGDGFGDRAKSTAACGNFLVKWT